MFYFWPNQKITLEIDVTPSLSKAKWIPRGIPSQMKVGRPNRPGGLFPRT